ncbi:hypothetical protein GCM10009735_73920 [Actinomadura chokoriensis]
MIVAYLPGGGSAVVPSARRRTRSCPGGLLLVVAHDRDDLVHAFLLTRHS